MRTHELKTHPSAFRATFDGDKTFELRRNDRDFAVGDRLVLREFDPSTSAAYPSGHYTGERITLEVSYVLFSGQFPGLEKGFVILGLHNDVRP